MCITRIKDATSDLNNQIGIRYKMHSVGGRVIKLGLSSVDGSTSLESNLTKSTYFLTISVLAIYSSAVYQPMCRIYV